MGKFQSLFAKHKTFIQNYSYLSILQVFNLLLPLITYPYLIRVLGEDIYGLVVFAQAISIFFSIFIDFGFNITATKQVSINRDNKVRLSEIVSSVIIIKIILGLISFVILVGLVFFIPELSKHKLLYIFAFTVCLNDLFFSQWFFQGIEEMKYITIVSVISRSVFAFLIFIMVQDKSDYLLVPLITGVGAFLNVLASVFIIFKIKAIKFILPQKKVIRLYFNEALPLFWSRLISKVKDQSNTVFIGSSIGMTEVAYYDLANKLVNIVNSFIETVTIAIFPKLSHSKDVKATRDFFKITLLLEFLAYVMFLLVGKYIVLIIGGEKMMNSALLLPIVGLFLLRSSSYFIGNIILIINNKTKPYINSLYVSGFSYFVGVGIAYLLNIAFTIELFIYISLMSLILECLYRGYACKRYNLLDRLINIKNK